jgi:D-inositol-3-phosphate glycosyltransferase
MIENKLTIGIIEPVGGHGGMDYYDYGLAYGLGLNNIEVFLFTSSETLERNYQNVTTFYYFKNMWRSNFVIKSMKYIMGHIKAFMYLKRNKAKLVHLHFFSFRSIDYIILLIASLYKLKKVITVHDINSFDKSGNKIVERLCYKLIDGVIVHNKTSAKSLLEKNNMIKNVAIIPHGNYLPFIKPLQFEKQKVFTILFFGQIKNVKGVEILLNAAAIIKKRGFFFKLIIAGRPWKSDSQYYSELIKSLALEEVVETEFRYIEDNEISSFFKKSDLIVLPYKEIYQSGVLLLTMSYSKPVLCSDLDPFKEIIIDAENGFLFKSENANDLADKLIFIIENPKILLNVIKAANDTITMQYAWPNIGLITRDFYTKIIQ